MIVDLFDLARRNRELGPPLAVLVVAIRYHRVQTVVAAIELDHDQDSPLRGRRCAGQGIRGAGQKQWDRFSAGQERTEEPRPRRSISRRVACMGKPKRRSRNQIG